MDFIQTSNKQVDKFGPGKHGFSAGNPAGGVPATYFSPDWADGVQQEHINLIEGAGLAPSGASLAQARQAIKRIAGGNVTTVNFAASPFQLAADHAGMVLVDAAAGNITIGLPAVNVLTGLPYNFRRTDTSANTVTINAAGADTIDGGTSFLLVPGATRQIRSGGATTWATVAPLAATQVDTDAGNDDGLFVTPKKLRFGFAASLTANGYIKFPTWLGGWVVQWGQSAAPTAALTNVVTTFPTAFPSACHQVFLTDFATLNNNGVIWTYHTPTVSNFTSFWTAGATAPGSTGTRSSSYLAIGK